jgi:hypothetical protein
MPAFRRKLERWRMAGFGLLATLSAAALAPGRADAMTFSLDSQADGRTVLSASGPILPGDFGQLIRFLDTMDKVKRMARLVIDSPGGFVNEAEKMAVTIHNIGLPVAVPEGATCASACVLLLAAAPQRSAGEGARIGVHRASFFGQENRATLGATDGMVIHYEIYGVPRPIVEKMRATPPGGVTWLTEEDLAKMRIAAYHSEDTAEAAAAR